MKIRLLILLVFILAMNKFIAAQDDRKPIDWVDVFIGTSNSRWMLGPYATAPFGMIQLGPDNQGYVWMGGYDYAINSISGFSHIHAWTMAGLRMMPATTDLVFEDRPVDAAYKGGGAGYHSRILKETEKASPGYYSVHLYDHDVFAEMTVTTRCGFQKYTFPEKDESRVLIDLFIPAEYRYSVLDAEIKRVSDTEIEGYAHCMIGKSSWNEYTLNFVLKFDTPFNSFNGWTEGKLQKNIDKISGKNDIGAYVTYKTNSGDVVMVKSGISLVSIDQARLNMKTELDGYGWDFNAVKNKTRETWAKLLSRVEVEGGTDVDKMKFYTNLYRCYAAKQTWNDVDGKYMDPCEKVQQMPEGQDIYGGDSFWNSFWDLNTTWSLVSPELMENYIETQLELFRKNGWTSVGPTGVEYTGIMEVSHEIAMIIGAYQKGIRNYDIDEAYRAVHNIVTVQGRELLPCSGLAGNEFLDVYVKKGYVPFEIDAASRTMDYAYDDFCVAQMAKALGKKNDYKYLIKRSENWKNIFNQDLKYVVPKDSSGQWMTDYNPFSGKHFVEGNGWQYTLYVPHDIPGLINMTGKDLFNSRLEKGFEKSVSHRFAAHAFDRYQPEAVEYYINMGNQVNMQSPFLFNYSGKPWLTQKYTRAILDTYYGSTPYHGWEGDEDEGQMGAWFVNTAMGMFEMEGGCETVPMVNLTSPLFSKITIKLDNKYYKGSEFTIEARNNSKENIYIQSATLNNKPLNSVRIKFKDIVDGGSLVLIMGPEPNKEWGINY
ncbi:MAG TPA: glycoside hydrolase family 92 protein [Bacteroidales bacterium]|nr:glycoside hydrolase family 92 protein [Bacteroidales bacterium]